MHKDFRISSLSYRLKSLASGSAQIIAEQEFLETLQMHYFKQLPAIKDLAVR